MGLETKQHYKHYAIIIMLSEKMFLYILTLLHLSSVLRGDGGVNRGVALLRGRIPNYRPTQDIILSTIVLPCEEAAYKLQYIRVKLGMAWELALTDFGFVKSNQGFDLVSERRKIALELKNSRRVSSVIKRHSHQVLKRFKEEHPDYTVVFGYINGGGVTRMKEGVQYMYGPRLLNFLFENRQMRVINRFRQAVRQHFH